MDIDGFLDEAGVPFDGKLWFIIWAYDMFSAVDGRVKTDPLYTIYLNMN